MSFPISSIGIVCPGSAAGFVCATIISVPDVGAILPAALFRTYAQKKSVARLMRLRASSSRIWLHQIQAECPIFAQSIAHIFNNSI
jgi:hypothetical protein